MKTISNELREDRWILVEDRHLREAKFTRQWLQAAIDADRLLLDCYPQDPAFRPSLIRLEGPYGLEFSSAAMAFLTMCLEDGVFFLCLETSEWADPFAFMAATGFFTRTGDRYEATLPEDLTIQTIKNALLELVATEDDLEGDLHPECLLTTMTEFELNDCMLKLTAHWGTLDRPLVANWCD